jgi:hypothetical protein
MSSDSGDCDSARDIGIGDCDGPHHFRGGLVAVDVDDWARDDMENLSDSFGEACTHHLDDRVFASCPHSGSESQFCVGTEKLSEGFEVTCVEMPTVSGQDSPDLRLIFELPQAALNARV